ncbi:hypothetical protein [Candidatus Hodgkinia cicadicola]
MHPFVWDDHRDLSCHSYLNIRGILATSIPFGSSVTQIVGCMFWPHGEGHRNMKDRLKSDLHRC